MITKGKKNVATIFFRLWRKWAETKFLLKLQNQFFLHMQLKTTGLLKAWASLIAQLVKNPSAMREAPVQFLVGKIRWRRDRLPTPVFLGFPGGSAGKESPAKRETWAGKIP